MREGINRKEFRVLKRLLESWGPQMSGKSVLARMDNTTAVSCANYGDGRVPQLATLARGVKELELRCIAAALRTAGRGDSVADALARFPFARKAGTRTRTGSFALSSERKWRAAAAQWTWTWT